MDGMRKFELIIIDSGASIPVAPKNFCTKMPLGMKNKDQYKIQNASGKKLKVYGTRQIPFTFNQNKIFLKFIICDVVQPLISTNDLLNAGTAIIIEKQNPMIRVNKTNFPLTPLNKHFCL